MSVQYLEDLRKRELDVVDFRARLAGYPSMLERAETAHRLFEEYRRKLVECVGVVHESRGLRAGISLAKPFVGPKKEMLKGLVAAKKVSVPEAKEFMSILISFDEDFDKAIARERDQQMSKEGAAQAHHFGAAKALEEIALAIARVENRASMDDVEASEEVEGGPGYNRKAKKSSRKKRSPNGVGGST